MSNASSYFTFNALLEAHHIDLKDVKYYCHTVLDRGQASNYELFMNEPEKFDEEQEKQATKDVFPRPYLASFVQTSNNETVFVGLYKKIDFWKDDKTNCIYNLERCTELSQWSGRIFVDYPSGRSVDRDPLNIDNGLPIVQISKSKKPL